MFQQENIENFLLSVCQNKDLQDQLKAPCPATREGFVNVAKKWGYSFSGVDIDKYVRFSQFYQEFQAAIDKHQSDTEELSDWLKKWGRHVKSYTRDDEQDKISRYMRG